MNNSNNNIESSKEVQTFSEKAFAFWYKVCPVTSRELKKFIPLSLMVFLSLFVYTMLRSTKDSILVVNLGAEMISTAKLFGVLPSAIIFMLIYTKLSSVVSRNAIYYGLTAFFVAYFLAYKFIFFPFRGVLTLDLGSNQLEGGFLKLPLIMLENWTITSFYIMSELWGSVIYSLLFFQVANSITPTEQAKRFYPLMIGTIGQIGPLSAGWLAGKISAYSRSFSSPELAWNNTLTIQIILIAFCGFGLMVTYWYINSCVMTDKTQYNPEEISGASSKKKKVKLSLTEGLKLIFSSKYLGLIAILVLSYGVSINLVEGMWKASLRIYAPTENEYNEFMGQFLFYNSLGVIVGMVVGVQTMRLFSWFFNAIATPIMIGITGAIFFVLFMYRHDLEPTLAAMGISALTMAVTVGAVQNVLSKATKYTVFDPTKEMAYIPLDDELKSKGKAAVDVVGGRLGKSGGALIQYLLMSFTALPLVELGNALFAVFVVIIIIWIIGVKMLSKEYELVKQG